MMIGHYVHYVYALAIAFQVSKYTVVAQLNHPYLYLRSSQLLGPENTYFFTSLFYVSECFLLLSASRMHPHQIIYTSHTDV